MYPYSLLDKSMDYFLDKIRHMSDEGRVDGLLEVGELTVPKLLKNG